MCKVIEDMRNEVAVAVAQATAWQKTVEFVCRMLDKNLPVETIAELAAITEEQVKEIAAKRTA